MMVPVAVGAIVLGPLAGAILGGVFGATSFFQALGMSPFGAALMAINPFYTFILTMVPRILMGWLTGLIFQRLYQNDKTRFFSYGAASLSAALLNTIFFMSFLILLFGNSDYIRGFRRNEPPSIYSGLCRSQRPCGSYCSHDYRRCRVTCLNPLQATIVKLSKPNNHKE